MDLTLVYKTVLLPWGTRRALSAKVGTYFANKRRSFGRYSSPEDCRHGVFLFFVFMDLTLREKYVITFYMN
jgi:hypothetical protein